MTVVLLGPQRFDPTLAEAARAVGVTGPIALVTAGWQERESEDEDLSAHLGGGTVNLRLHRRADEVFAADKAFTEAYRARQLRLRQMQEVYRVRLGYLVEAARVVAQTLAPDDLLEEEERTSIEALRALDREHVRRCREVVDGFREQHTPSERPLVVEHRQAIAELLRDCEALAIAGGHVATILNRLRLFDVAGLVGERPILAWSAGAMAITERVALFHDDPPNGISAPQLFGPGLGLVPGVLALPDPKVRLRLDEPERMAGYALRFAPAACVALPRCAWVVSRGGVITEAHGALRLEPDGTVALLEEVLR